MVFGRSRRRSRRSDEPDNTPNTPVNWPRLFGYLRPYLLRMALSIVMLAFYSAIGLIFPMVIGQLLQSVFQQKDLNQLNTITLALVGLFFLQAAASFIQSYNLTYIGERIVM